MGSRPLLLDCGGGDGFCPDSWGACCWLWLVVAVGVEEGIRATDS